MQTMKQFVTQEVRAMEDRNKFKVWNKKKKEWVSDRVFLANDNQAIYIPSQDREVNENTHYIVWCTGIEAKYRDFIYEGDIVKVYNKKYLINWQNCMFRAKCLEKNNYFTQPLHLLGDSQNDFKDDEPIIIIGNKYENPESLKN